MSLNIIVVEDEAIVRKDLVLTLSRLGYRVAGEASSAEEAAALAEASNIDLVLLDIKLRGQIDGYHLAHRLSRLSPASGIIIMSAYTPPEEEQHSVAPNVIGYLAKPFDVSTLETTLENAARALKTLRSEPEPPSAR